MAGIDLSLPLEACRLNLRVSAILLHEGRMLVMRNENTPYYYPPGGRIAQNEPSADALRRELREELGAQPSLGRLLWVAESFFVESTTGERFHEIGFYYLAQHAPGDGLCLDAAFERPDDCGKPQQFLWHPVDALHEIDLRPAFLQQEVPHLPACTQHLLDIQPTVRPSTL